MARLKLVQPGLWLPVTPTNSPFSTALYGTLVPFHTPLLLARVPLINAKSHNQVAGGRSRNHPEDRESQWCLRRRIHPKRGAHRAASPAASALPQTSIHGKPPCTVAGACCLADFTYPLAATNIRFWFSRRSYCQLTGEPRDLSGYGRNLGTGK